MAMNLAISQVFIGNLASSTTLLGVYQGSYGIGGILGPLIATSLVSRGLPWSRFYLLTLGVAAFNIIFAGWSFFHYERDSAPQLLSTLEQTASRQQASETSEHGAKGGWQTFKTTLNNKPTYLGAMFIFAYQGAEVSISGWVISFLVNYRNGDPSRVGYVTAGFWGGITLGTLPCCRNATEIVIDMFRSFYPRSFCPLCWRKKVRICGCCRGESPAAFPYLVACFP